MKTIEYLFIMQIYQYSYIKSMFINKQMFILFVCCFDNIWFRFQYIFRILT